MSSEVYKPPENEVAAPPEGSNGSIYSSVQVITAKNAMTQNKLNNIVGGSRRRRQRQKSRKFKGGASDSITVPVIRPIFKDTGSGNNTISANVKNLTILGATENENCKYDSLVGVKTGGKKSSTFKGGQHVHWGCMSGGKSRRKKGSRRKRRKSRRRR